MRILEMRSENFKRLSVVQITPDGNLIQVCGPNTAGKSSVLDSIWAALGGKDAAPDQPIRKGKNAARIELKLGNGSDVALIVERTITAKGNYVTVRGADGGKYDKPQKVLDDLMGLIGFDPLAFMRLKPAEQFEMLRGTVKMDIDIDALDRKRATVYEDRTGVNRDLASAKARSTAIVVPDDLPDEQPDIAAITDRLAGIDEFNTAIRAKMSYRYRATLSLTQATDREASALRELEDARRHAENCQGERIAAELALEEAQRVADHAGELQDVAAIRAELDAANRLTEGFRRQQTKIAAEAEVTTLTRRSTEKTAEIEALDATKAKALAEAKMPIEGLSFEDGTVIFGGLPLAQASSAQQLRVSAAIGAALNPKLRVILARDGSLLDSKSLQALAAFADENDMQIWLEVVNESGQVGIVMEDGHVKGQEALVAEHEKADAEKVAEPDAPAPTPEPGSDAEKRARSYLDAMIKQLANRKSQAECEGDNAAVKVKLARFPDLVRAEWAPAYLARMKALAGK
ncbi:MAG TPA: AAA family ATPase [Terracidiphilus sp.]|jgi:hypothetical protein